MRVLISAIAGDIGFGIGRILKDWKQIKSIYGIDIHDDHPGRLIFDKTDIAPKANKKNYIDWTIQYIKKNNINLFIPASESEILVVSKNLKKFIPYTQVLINNYDLVDLCLDKYNLLKFLSKNNISIPNHGLVSKNIPTNYPIISKPRYGSGSQNILIINSLKEFQQRKKRILYGKKNLYLRCKNTLVQFMLIVNIKLRVCK